MDLKQGAWDVYGEGLTTYCRKVVFSIIVLSLIIFSIYGNSFDCSWQFDDRPNITENRHLRLKVFTWDSIKRSLFSDQRDPDKLYRPVACLSFALNYYFGRLHVFGYHLVNVIIHLFSSIFLFLFLYHTLNLPTLKGAYASKSYSIAILSSILWAINPVQTQTVTYIVQRMASLSGMFYMISMYLYLRARTAKETGGRLFFFISCFISFVMAVGSKENAATLPISLLLYETLLIQKKSGQFVRKNIRAVLLVTGAALLLGVIYVYCRSGDLSSILFGGYGKRPFSMAQRLLTEPGVIVFYISLLIYPVPNRLSIAHPVQISTSLFDPIWTLPAILIICGSLVYLILMARRHPLFSFCLLFFFLNHLIESTILPLELIFEHRNYLPSMLFFVPVSIGFCHLLERYARGRTMTYTVMALMALLLAGLGHATYLRNFAWKNQRSLWMDAAKKAPDQFRVHHNLGQYYQDHGWREQAVFEYEKALKSKGIHRKNEKIITYYNLGKLYETLEHYEKSKTYYQNALHMKPNFSHALGSLATIYDKEGKRDQADHYLFRALRADPGNPHINFNMGVYWLKANRPDRAIYHLRRSMGDERLGKRALLYLGIAYKQKGRLGRAAIHFQKALTMDSRNITPHLHLVEIYSITGHKILCQQEAKKIVRLMMHDDELFHRTLDLISMKGHMGHVQLAPSVILPVISRAWREKTGRLNKWKGHLEKILEKEEKIR